MQFFQELYSHIDKKLGEKFEDMFLVKIASKRTSLTTMGNLPTPASKAYLVTFELI